MKDEYPLNEDPEGDKQIVLNATEWAKRLPDELIANWSILDLVKNYLSNCEQDAIDPLTMKKLDLNLAHELTGEEYLDPDDLVEHEERWDGMS